MNALKLEGAKASTDKLRWVGYVAVRRLGRSGLAAVALLVVLLAIDSFVLRPAIDATNAEREVGLRTLENMPEPRMHQGKPGMSLAQVQKLQVGEQAYSALRILKRHNLTNLQVNYRSQPEVKGRLGRLYVDITLTGSYVDFRAAMREVADRPMTRIERFSVERQDVDRAVIDASLRISFLGAGT